MAQLSAHPYIVTIFHADVSADGRPYFVMEYCSGPSLAERYKREPFAVEDALRTGIRLAGAVATAHAAGILHRDIKPANVLTNDYGWPALTDFGISSTSRASCRCTPMTVAGRRHRRPRRGQSAVGMSVPWSPPEMFEDDPQPDERSDVFSLAATITRCSPAARRSRSRAGSNGSPRPHRPHRTRRDHPDRPRRRAAQRSSSVLAKGMAVVATTGTRAPSSSRAPSSASSSSSATRRPPSRCPTSRRSARPPMTTTRMPPVHAPCGRCEAQPRPAPPHDDATRARDAAAGRRAAPVGAQPAPAPEEGTVVATRRRAAAAAAATVAAATSGGLVDATGRAMPARPADPSAPSTTARPSPRCPSRGGCRVGGDPHRGVASSRRPRRRDRGRSW